jgi:hypothetical protein
MAGGEAEPTVVVPAADLSELADAMDDLWAAMRETSKRSDPGAAYDYLFARAGLVAMRCSGLVEQGRALRRGVITPPSCPLDGPTQFAVREAT